MPLTPADILDRLGEMEGAEFSVMSEDKKRVRVAHVKAALRWAWKTTDPLFAFPSTVNSGTVAVTAGLIAPTLLGEGTWGSFYESDPRPAGSQRREVPVQVSHEGVHPLRAYASVFAFYRMAVPTFDYEVASVYATPADIPDEFLDIVALKALYALFISMEQWEAVNVLGKSYGDPAKHRDAMVEALRNSGLVWDGNAVALTPAAV